MSSKGTVDSYNAETKKATISVEETSFFSGLIGAFSALGALFSGGDLTTSGTTVYCGQTLGIAMLVILCGGIYLGAWKPEWFSFLPGVKD